MIYENVGSKTFYKASEDYDKPSVGAQMKAHFITVFLCDDGALKGLPP
jgi:hypothetical protein